MMFTGKSKCLKYGAALLLSVIGVLSGCNGEEPESVRLANPASENCVSLGGELEFVEEDGGVAGYCLLPDGTRCEEWALFRKECPSQAADGPASE